MSFLRSLVATYVAVLALLWSTDAAAGTFYMHGRSAGALTEADVAVLEADAKAWPFDCHVLLASEEGMGDLADRTHALVIDPHVLAIGIDLDHRSVVVRYGTGLGVGKGDYAAIREAGSPYFAARETRGGIEAIANAATAEMKSKDTLMFWIFVVVIVGVLVIVVLALLSRGGSGSRSSGGDSWFFFGDGGGGDSGGGGYDGGGDGGHF